MIKFDSLTLKAFINENTDYLKNSSVRKIQQPSRRELILHLRNNGINKKLYININPEFFHVCFLENVEKRGIIIPNAAPMFCMLLRKYILNCKISKVEQPNGERILELYFEYSDAIGETETLCLAIELMGKYSNIILYNKKTGIILGCAHNVGEEKSKVRELAGTLPYIYPEKQEKSDIMQTTETEFANNLDGNFDETSLSFTLSTEYDYLTIPLAKQAISKAVENFIDIWGMKYDSFFQNVLYINAHPTFVINMYGYNNSYIPKDIAEGFSTGFTVSFTMIQLAIYMGFEEIYLLGHDFSMPYYKDKWAIPHKTIERNAHFGKNYSTKKTYLIKYSNLQSFLHAKEYCDRNNIIIKNATRGGKLEVFDRISLEDCIRENMGK